MNEFEFKNLLMAQAKIASVTTLIELGHQPRFIKKAAAYKLMGRGLVDRWITNGKIIPVKQGANNSAVMIDITELYALQASENHHIK